MKYTYTDEKLSNGNTMHYKTTPDGTAYHKDTPDQVVEILERLRNNGTRVRLYLGDAKTGRDWEEDYAVFGTIGRSGGRIKIPILLNNQRSIGGGSILDNCIVKIEYANKQQGGVMYQHPKYHRGEDPLSSRQGYKPRSKPGRKPAARKSSPAGFKGLN